MKIQAAIFLTYIIVISTIVLVPLKIIGYGYRPPDDAARHAAKAVSGKEWGDILVLRDDIKMDSHPGWHAILGFVRNITGWNTEGLVVFSVVFLIVLFLLVPIIILPRPESWLAALLALVVAMPRIIDRFFLGRPYIFTIFVLVVICSLWPRLKEERIPYKTLAIFIFLTAASTWIHGGWYLFLPVLCSFFLARERRAGFRLAVCLVAGIIIGSSFTGHPYIFLKQTLLHAIYAFGNHRLQRMLVGEFRPFCGDAMIVSLTLGMLAWRHMRGAWDAKRIDNPIFILAVSGWTLGFVSVRFWADWGVPALLFWMAQEFQEVFEERIGFVSLGRFFLTLSVAGTFYLAVTNDIGDRWSSALSKGYLSCGDTEYREWLPEPDGIVYSDNMCLFYDMFYENPHAPWRYILGFEPTMMPQEDLVIYRNIQFTYGADKSFEPWVKKMKPQDRLIIVRRQETPPNIPGLEWRYIKNSAWIGRLPR